MGLLSGMKVLDLTRVLAGPYCGMILADMGADVIKIELPGRGDDTRVNAPIVNGESAYFMNLNRNKYGMTLNLKSEEGKKIFIELVKQSDVVIENYRPGVMEKLGLGYEDLKKINPRIVYGCISGFGHYGPYSKRAGYDLIGQAMSGLMSTTGWPDTPPTRCGTTISDICAGMGCATGIMAAYVSAQKTGVGDKVDISLVDGLVSSLCLNNNYYIYENRIPQRIGNRYESIYPNDSFRASDGYCIIACGNNKLYGLLKSAIKSTALEAECFDTNQKRVENHKELKACIEGWTLQHTVNEVVDILSEVGVPAAPILSIDQVFHDPHIAGAREMFVECEHPVAGKTTLTNSHIKFKNNNTKIRMPAPLLGQHTDEILKERLGLSDEDIAKLRECDAL